MDIAKLIFDIVARLVAIGLEAAQNAAAAEAEVLARLRTVLQAQLARVDAALSAINAARKDADAAIEAAAPPAEEAPPTMLQHPPGMVLPAGE